jgi:hypothetical protein
MSRFLRQWSEHYFIKVLESCLEPSCVMSIGCKYFKLCRDPLYCLPTLKYHFLTKMLIEINNFQRNWWIIVYYIIFIFHLKFHTKISLKEPHSWNIFLIFHILWRVLFWSKYVHHIQNLHLLWMLIKELNKSNSKLFKSPQSS